MVLKNTGSFRLAYKGKTGILYIPADLVKDSSFPLKEGEVEIEISDNTLIVKRRGE